MDSVDAVTQWTKYSLDAVDAVCSGCSRIVVYAGGTLSLIKRRSNQRTEWMQQKVE